MRFLPLPLFALTVLLALCPGAAAQTLQISEFMASNINGVHDDDDTPQAWVEIWNPNQTQKASLNSWKLRYGTTSQVTWTFPNVELPPDQRILIWLSGKDRRVSTAPLHTDFVVTKEESNLSLLNPQNAVVSDLGATYPAQMDDVSYGRDPVVVDAFGFYTNPTPDAPNNYTGAGVAGKVKFVQPSLAFSDSLEVEIEEVTPVPGATIRYTTNDTTPTATSTPYMGPISVVETTPIRARAFVEGLLPGETETRGYLRLGNTTEFSSAMPLIVISSFRGVPDANTKKAGYMWVFNPGSDGSAKLTNPPDIATRVVMDLRGSSTIGNPKYNLNIESRRSRDEGERDIPLLGMPSHSDWVFGAPYSFDPSRLHNPFIYALSNRIGRYATRIKEAEVFIKVNNANNTNTALTFTGGRSGDYFGIYNVGEKIRRGDKRVDIRKLNVYDNGEFEKTGGYIVKMDRLDTGDQGFSVPHSQHNPAAYYYPREPDFKIPQRAPQDAYIRKFMTDFANSCYPPFAFDDLERGYRAYLDVGAAIDHHLLNVWSFNVDAIRLSGYMHKERGGKLEYGPIWDFDRSLSSTDGRDANPAVWRSTVPDLGTDFFNDSWWMRLFSDIEFYQAYIDRWAEIRRNEASPEKIDQLIDDLNAEMSTEAVSRDLARWANAKRPWRSPFTNVVYPASQDAEVQRLKDYLQQRANFMDSQWVNPVIISPAEGNVPVGTDVTLTVANPTGVTIYYTTDGSDPRSDGDQAPTAANVRTYDGTPISITATTRIRARAYKPTHVARTGANNPPRVSHWSADINGRFSTDIPAGGGSLVVTELNYHPTGPTTAESMVNPGWDNKDFEFIELRNISGAPIDLLNVALTAGVNYAFSGTDALTLNAGGYVVVASNPDAFRQRYGDSVTVVGPWTGDLASEGENLVLKGADGSVLVDLTYSDQWYPSADGGGSSIEYIGTAFTTGDYNNSANWRPSFGVGGSPGEAGINEAGPVVINEILSNSLLPRVDAIELFNPTANDVDISGWYLSDGRLLTTVEGYQKFRIPDATIIPGGGYLVFTEEDFNPNGAWNPAPGVRGPNEFAFDGDHGDTAVLIEADATGNLIRFVDRVDFGAAREDESWGRWPNGTGGLYPMAQQTLLDAGSPDTPWPPAGGENSEPRVGPLVITEVHHTPAGDDANLEFVEIHNPTTSAQSLANWRLRGDVDFDFIGESLPPGGVAVLTAFAPTDAGLAAAFRTAYGIGDEVVLFGPWDAGERLEPQGRVVFYRAEDPPPLEPAFFPLTIEDETNYASGDPWPVTTDGNSLSRLRELRAGDDPAGWVARVPNPGRVFNAPPVVVADTLHLPVSAGQVTVDALANDSDPDGDPLTIIDVTNGNFGTTQTDGSVIVFTPGPEFNGNDTFNYTISDGAGGTATGAVVLTNLIPVAGDDAYHPVLTGGEIMLDVRANDSDLDGDPLLIVDVTNGSFGTAQTDGSVIVFTPGAGFNGNDIFSYTISDGAGGTAVAVVVLSNLLPVAGNDAYHPAFAGGEIILDVRANDSDPDGDPLTIATVGDALTGTTSTDGTTISFTPGPLFDGNDSFDYTITDGFGAFVTASVIFANSLPNAADDMAATDGSAVVISVLANDSDSDADPLTILSILGPQFGDATVNGADITYTPGPGFRGSDSFPYTVSDGHGGIATATVTIRSVSALVFTEATTGSAVPGMPNATLGSLQVPAIGHDGLLSWLGKVRLNGSSEQTPALFGGVDSAMLLMKGVPVPGISGASFKKFSDPLSDGAGQTVFIANFKGSGIQMNKNDSAVFAATDKAAVQVVARIGDAAPEFVGRQLKSFLAFDAEGGETVYVAKVKGGKEVGVWASDGGASRLVTRSGLPLTTPLGPKVIKKVFVLPSVKGSSGHGRSHRAGEVALHLKFTDKTEGLGLASFDGTAWTTDVIALSNQLTDLGGTWNSFGIPALSTEGDMVAVCQLNGAAKTSDEAVVAFVDGTATAIAREGTASPMAGAVFKSFSDPVANHEGSVAFMAKLDGSAIGKKNDNALFHWDATAGVTALAQEQQAAIGAPGSTWKKFTSFALPSGMDSGPVFLATLKGSGVNKKNDEGLWAQASDGSLILLARTGQPMAVGGSTRVLAKLALLNSLPLVQGSGRSYNDDHQIVFLATFTDGSQAIQTVHIP